MHIYICCIYVEAFLMRVCTGASRGEEFSARPSPAHQAIFMLAAFCMCRCRCTSCTIDGVQWIPETVHKVTWLGGEHAQRGPCTARARERVECEEREACGFRKASSEFACDFLARIPHTITYPFSLPPPLLCSSWLPPLCLLCLLFLLCPLPYDGMMDTLCHEPDGSVCSGRAHI